jgi:DNA polymerase-3 subunit beta
MEFTTDASRFAEALEQIQGAVDKKNTMPILSHCLVETSSQGLRLASTDLELGIRLFCPAQVKDAGGGAIPARRLLDIVQSVGEGDVRVREMENHWMRISSGRSIFKLAAMAKDNFPAMPDGPQSLGSVPAGALRWLIDRTAFAVSQDEGRYTLNATLLVLKADNVRMVATDGSRLPLAGQDVEVDGLQKEERLLIPKRALGALRRLADTEESDMPIHIAKDDGHLFFTVGDGVLIIRMISGQFPLCRARHKGKHAASPIMPTPSDWPSPSSH